MDTSQQPMGAFEGFDLIIVGAGAAGCVLASRLAERGDRRIALLDAGPELRPNVPPAMRDGWRVPAGADWPDWGFESAPAVAGGTTKLRRGRLLGGTSWLTRFAVRGAASDFDAWAAAGNAGWAFADVVPDFRRLEADREFGTRPWHGHDGPIPVTRYPEYDGSQIHRAAVETFVGMGHALVEDVNSPDAIGVGRMPMSSRDGERMTTLDAYLPTASSVPNLTVLPDSPVDRVLTMSGRATGVRLIDGTELAAKAVTLSAGVYGSPTILQRSGIGPAEALRALGIGVAVDLPGVGANLADHPAVELDSGARGSTGGPTIHSIATYRSALAPESGGPDLMFWLTDPDSADPIFYLDPILLRPRSRGTVRLRSADPSDPPIIDLPGVSDPADIERLSEGYRLGVDIAQRLAARVGRSETLPAVPATDAALRQLVREHPYSIPHTVGTCAMGASPGSGAVVDASGRVHGVDGLNVIDASIIPEPPSGFPHVITIMVAEHLARLTS